MILIDSTNPVDPDTYYQEILKFEKSSNSHFRQ